MSRTRKNILKPILFLAILLGIGLTAGYLYRSVYRSNLNLHGASSAVLLVPTGASFRALKDSLYVHDYIRDRGSFEWTAERKGLDEHVRPGRYRIRKGMSNTGLVDMLRSGDQEPVRVFFQNARTPAELAGRISRQIEADSLALLNLMKDREFLQEFNVAPATVFTIMIPNTYEFYWNTSARGFVTRMYGEARKFWKGARTQKADSIGLSVSEVVTLASIIEKETAMNSEKALIAGVYMNRLKRKMPLQADPTLIYAWNDYTIKRVLNRHKEIRSPYNTYKFPGLPPGPICIPSIASIDAVLNYRKTDYYYFCAKEDFSGYHNFARTLAEHNRNAARYQRALQTANTGK
jgi:UPF0755 protein